MTLGKGEYLQNLAKQTNETPNVLQWHNQTLSSKIKGG